METQPWREDLIRRGDVSEIVHDREGKVLRFFQEHDIFNRDEWTGIKAALCYAHNFVWQLPAIDAVEVTRCRDCRWTDPEESSNERVWCDWHGCYEKTDGYCNNGKPKESESPWASTYARSE